MGRPLRINKPNPAPAVVAVPCAASVATAVAAPYDGGYDSSCTAPRGVARRPGWKTAATAVRTTLAKAGPAVAAAVSGRLVRGDDALKQGVERGDHAKTGAQLGPRLKPRPG